MAANASIRDAALIHSGMAGIVARIVSALCSVASVALAVNALDVTQFGILATLAALVGIMGFADLGLGQGLLNELTDALARGDQARQRAVVSSASAVLLALGAGVALVGLAVAAAFPWNLILGAPDEEPQVVAAAVGVFGLSIGLAIPASVGHRVLLALQAGGVAHLWSAVSAVASLAATWLAATMSASLPVFVFAALGAPVLLSVTQTSWVLCLAHPELRPSRRLMTTAAARRLLSLGWGFLVLNLSAAVAYQSDVIIVASVLGAAAAGTFAIALRMFALVSGLFAGLTSQMWPSVTHALSTGDLTWVRSRFRRILVLTLLVASTTCITLAVAGQSIALVWVGPDLLPPQPLLWMLALWTIYSLAMGQCSTLLNGAGVIRPQAALGALMAAVNLPLSIILARHIGISGPVLGSLIAHGLFAGIPTMMLVRRVLTTGTNIGVGHDERRP
jgi:O-antigen/teichoic acid export membrane protein